MPRSRLYSPTAMTSRTRSCSNFRICWSTASMPRRSSSRSSGDVTSRILHINQPLTSLHHRLASRQDLHFQHITGAELVAGSASDCDMSVFRPFPARLRVVFDQHAVEIHIDEIGIWGLVVERNVAADRDRGRDGLER